MNNAHSLSGTIRAMNQSHRIDESNLLWVTRTKATNTKDLQYLKSRHIASKLSAINITRVHVLMLVWAWIFIFIIKIHGVSGEKKQTGHML